MKIYLMYLMILIISITIIILIQDKKKALNLLSKITIITSSIMIFFLVVLNIILKSNNFINISIFSNYLLKEYAINILYLFIIGIIELITSKYLIKNKKL